ncbi:DUF1720 domain-containing protein, partial [Kribbella sp. NPDC051137]|uniref:DUF1720 domain-containing protein n=1 Tax=Kribbella sp. NPDC051137 TaxID=3155045 RepID=UPI003416A2F1
MIRRAHSGTWVARGALQLGESIADCVVREVREVREETGFEAQVTGFEAQVTGFEAQVTGFEAQVTGFEAQVTGFEAQVT